MEEQGEEVEEEVEEEEGDGGTLPYRLAHTTLELDQLKLQQLVQP